MGSVSATEIALILALVVVDYYVFRNFRRFAAGRTWARRFVEPVYRGLLVAFPALLLAAVLRGNRSGFSIEAGSVLLVAATGYYIPKLAALAGLVVKDTFRFVMWLFSWFQKQLLGGTADPSDSTQLDLYDMSQLPRRKFVQQIGYSAASVPFVLVGYGVFKQLYDFEVRRVSVPVEGLPAAFDGLSVAHVSDIHAGSMFSTRVMLEAADVINQLRPDIIALTGDFVNRHHEEMNMIVPGLRALSAPLGVFGCLGNHDHYAFTPKLLRTLASTPVDMLVNENRTVEIDGSSLHVIGVDNTGHNQHFADLPKAVSGIETANADEARLLLAHDPTYWDLAVREECPEMDLTLSGHTHGGQVGLERGRVRVAWARIAYPRWAGLYEEVRQDCGRKHYLYVNRGLGTVGAPMRLGIRPEITLLKLTQA